MKRTPLKRKTPLRNRPKDDGKPRVYHKFLKKGRAPFSQLEKRKPMKQRSDKRVKEEKEYTRLRKEFLKEFPFCKVCLDEYRKDQVKFAEADCGSLGVLVHCQKSTQVHHKAKRGKYYLNVETWLPVCAEHHAKIEADRRWAESKGYTLTPGQIKRLP